MKNFLVVLLIACILSACSGLFQQPQEGIAIRERAAICFRQSTDRAHILAQVTPADCYSMRCAIPYQKTGTVVVDQREFRINFETTFGLREVKPLLGGCGPDCSGGGALDFDLSTLEVGLYHVFLWGNEIGELSVTSGLPWRDQCLPAEGADVSSDASLPEVAAAQQALTDFFERLRAGEYAAAADLYGGSYEIMLEHNPGLSPSDDAGLFEAACTINGAVCLEIASLESMIPEGPEADFAFRVQFANEDGSTFVLGPCCGAPAGETRTEFTFHVRKTAGSRFVVVDSPIYMP